MNMTIGIYKITNTINQKFYIGSSVNLELRWRVHKHRLRTQKHANKFLLGEYKKYGESNFIFEIIEKCSQKNILEIEQKYLDRYYDNQQKCYNLAKISSAPMLGKKWNKEQKKKASLERKGRKPSIETIKASIKRTKGKTWEQNYGKEKAKQMKEKIIKYHKNRTKIHQEKLNNSYKERWQDSNYREKMVKIAKDKFKNGYKHHNNKKIAQYDLQGNFIEIFENAITAAKTTGLLANCMRQVATGKKKTHGGFLWRYV